MMLSNTCGVIKIPISDWLPEFGEKLNISHGTMILQLEINDYATSALLHKSDYSENNV